MRQFFQLNFRQGGQKWLNTPIHHAETQDSRIVDLAIRLMFLGLFIYSAIVMVTPLARIFIWAVILCVAVYPVFDWIQAKLGGRKGDRGDARACVDRPRRHARPDRLRRHFRSEPI